MKNVILRGPVLTKSGYGVHSRQIFRWLLARERTSDIKLRINATIWGTTSWHINASDCDGVIGEIMSRTVDAKLTEQDPNKADVSVQVQLPNEWNNSLAKFNVGVTAGVETDRCNPAWIESINKMNLVIVPSQHTKSVFLNSGTVTTPITVVPESYPSALTIDNDSLTNLGDLSTTFNFLVFGQITGTNPMNDRKNIFFTIKWLCELFKDKSDVGIVLKTNAAQNTLIDRRVVTNIVKQLLAEVRKGPYPKLHLFHGDMSDIEVASLYRHPSVKALVALTRGEGYGLPILEAAACGLPVIATPWSGHMDFLKHGKFVKVQYQLEQIHPTRVDDNIFMKDARWASACELDFKKRAQKFYDNSEIPCQWARALKEKIVEQYSFDSIARAYDEAFKDIIC